jgi:hypothetical protein
MKHAPEFWYLFDFISYLKKNCKTKVLFYFVGAIQEGLHPVLREAGVHQGPGRIRR